METRCSSSCPDGFDHDIPDLDEVVLITEIEGDDLFPPFGVLGRVRYTGAGGCSVIKVDREGCEWPIAHDVRVHWLPIQPETPEYDQLKRWSQGIPFLTVAIDLASDDFESAMIVKGGPGVLWYTPRGDVLGGAPGWMRPEGPSRAVEASRTVSDVELGPEAVKAFTFNETRCTCSPPSYGDEDGWDHDCPTHGADAAERES